MRRPQVDSSLFWYKSGIVWSENDQATRVMQSHPTVRNPSSLIHSATHGVTSGPPSVDHSHKPSSAASLGLTNYFQVDILILRSNPFNVSVKKNRAHQTGEAK
jgi:hypothetical protein